MEKAGYAQFHPTLKRWASHPVKLGRMKIESKKAKVSPHCPDALCLVVTLFTWQLFE